MTFKKIFLFLFCTCISGYVFAEQDNSAKNANQYQKACLLNDATACGNLGVLYAEGKGIKQDSSKALIYFEKACNLKNGQGCNNAGLFYEKGDAVKKNISKASSLYQKACELKTGEGCYNLGVLFEDGSDFSKAASFYEKGCKSGNGPSCTNIGGLYYDGAGVKQDFNKASSFYEKACQLDEVGGCVNLGVLYYYGKGIKKNQDKAASIYKKACELNEPIGCLNYAAFSYGKNNDNQAEQYYKIGCEKLKNPQACYNLGNIVFLNRNNSEQAMSFLSKACSENYYPACAVESVLLQQAGGAKQAKLLFEKNREKILNSEDGKINLWIGLWYKNSGDKQKANLYRTKGENKLNELCRNGDQGSCRLVKVFSKLY